VTVTRLSLGLAAGAGLLLTAILAGTHEQGVRDAQTYADYISYDMEHAPFDVKGLAEYMRGLVAGARPRVATALQLSSSMCRSMGRMKRPFAPMPGVPNSRRLEPRLGIIGSWFDILKNALWITVLAFAAVHGDGRRASLVRPRRNSHLLPTIFKKCGGNQEGPTAASLAKHSSRNGYVWHDLEQYSGSAPPDIISLVPFRTPYPRVFCFSF